MPFSRENVIAVVRPVILEVTWLKEYYFRLEGPEGASLVGHGWQPEGQLVVLRASQEIYGPEGDERFSFLRWEGVSNAAIIIPNPQSYLTSVRADGPHVVSAKYQKEYLVLVKNGGQPLQKAWVMEGKDFVVDAPSLIETVPGAERLRFTGWEGGELNAARGTVVVSQPLSLKPLYQKEFMVQVSAPFGAAGDGWYAEGAIDTIKVPPKASGILFLNREFESFPGYASEGSTLQIPVTGPLTVTAFYRTQVDLKTLGIVLGVILVGLAIYLVTQMERWRRPKGEQPGP